MDMNRLLEKIAQNHSQRLLPAGSYVEGGYEKSRFSTSLFYLGIDTRYGHSYYGTLIGNRMQSMEWRYCN